MKDNATRGTIIAVVGIYLCYLGVGMLRDTKAGISKMPMTLTIIFMALMIIAGILVTVYGARIFLSGWREQKDGRGSKDAGKDKEEEK